MVLAPKQTGRPKVEDRRHGDIPTYQTKVPKTYSGEKTASSTNGAGKTGNPYAAE